MSDTNKTDSKKEPKYYDLSEVEAFLCKYEKWYEDYLDSQTDSETATGENPTPPPPPPPGGPGG